MAVLAVAGCGDSENLTELTTGRLEIITSTTGPEPDADGYTVQVDTRAAQATGTSASQTTDLPPGDYTVQLADLSANCQVQGENPRSVTVTAGTTTATTFVITCRPTQGAKIAFLSDRDGSFDIFVMNADGTEQRNLTFSPAVDGEPVWSPDGSKLAFQSDRNDRRNDIFVINPDGSGLTNLTRDPESDLQPVWSPDGRKIAFTSARNGNFEGFLMNADGSEQRSLTPDQNTSSELQAWSPDGTRIAFLRGRIYVINANGTGQTPLTSVSGVIDCRWSPDGSRIAFVRLEVDADENAVSNLWVINADGGNERSLTNFALGPMQYNSIFGFSWAPDGSKLAFASNDDIFAIHPDGTGLVNLTNSPFRVARPSWSPDGTQIAFSAFVADQYDVFVMSADGSNRRNLTNNPAFDGEAVWSP